MRRIIIIMLIIFANNLLVAQHSTPDLEANKQLLPNIIPPSPEAFSFVRYGKNSISEYTGKLNTSIPIYDYKDGQISTPISLNYSGAGVKVEDMPTWTGINWTLITGGVITRQIKDGADEGVTQRKIVDMVDLKANTEYLCSPNSQYYVDLARQAYLNSEVDIFNFNLNGYSGSFYLDVNFNPVYIENENELKIEIIGNSSSNLENLRANYTFCITTPDGVKYYFGGNITETTRVLSGSNSIDTDGVTSFYLFKIMHPVNGEILFEYDTLTPRILHINRYYTVKASYGPYYDIIEDFKEKGFVTKINNIRRLRKIRSVNNDIEVIFNRTDYDNYNFTSILNSIEIKKNTTLLKKVDFTYEAKLNPTGTNNFQESTRFFLTKVEINKDFDIVGNKSETYTFEYNNPFSLPSRRSNSRDALGYFNNKTNVSLIPEDKTYKFRTTNGFANLMSDSEFATRGSLTKITYPTKGYSKFEYELVPAKKEIIKHYAFRINSYPSNELESPLEQNYPGYNSYINEYIQSPVIYQDQTISIKIDLHTMPHTVGSNLVGKGVEFIIKDITDSNNISTTVFTQLFLEINNGFNYSFQRNHIYTLQLRFKDNYVSGDSNILEAEVGFEIFEGYEIISGLGVRLKNDKNYSNDDVLIESKYYKYGTINGGFNNENNIRAIKFQPKITLITPDVSNNSNERTAILSSENLNEYMGGFLPNYTETYPVVSISLGGNNFEQGGIEKTFIEISNTPNARIKVLHDGCYFDGVNNEIYCGAPLAETRNTIIRDIVKNYKMDRQGNESQINGKLICERHYSKIGNSLFKVKERVSEYKIEVNDSKKVINFLGAIILPEAIEYAHCPDNPSVTLMQLYQHYIGYYFTKVFDSKLISIKETNYIEPVAMNDYKQHSFYDKYVHLVIENYQVGDIPIDDNISQDQLEAPYRKITTTQNFEYGTLKGLPTKITTLVSDGTLKTTENIYVNQSSNLTGLTPDQTTAFNKLVTQNNVANPIEVKQFSGSTLTSQQRTLYKTLPDNKIVTDKIQTTKGNLPLEDRAIFEEYDAKGNPTLVSLVGGAKIKYLYNSNNQPIAKIENFTGSLDPNTTSISDACSFISQYPASQVTIFEYDNTTNLLIRTYDKNCQKKSYEYDELHRLKYIKDNDNNIIQEFDQNYRPN